MSRHFCRVTVPAKASSASSLCSAAPYASSVSPNPTQDATPLARSSVAAAPFACSATQVRHVPQQSRWFRHRAGRRGRGQVTTSRHSREGPTTAGTGDALPRLDCSQRPRSVAGTAVAVRAVVPTNGADRREHRPRRRRAPPSVGAPSARRPRASLPLQVGRTPAISCEAVPASEMGRRGHEPALLPRNGAGESFVSFIALFGSARSHLRRRSDSMRRPTC